MDCSQKVSVASTASDHCSTPKSSISGKTDENKNTMDLMDSPQNPQRKKILCNKNDAPVDIIPPPQNSLNLEDGVKSNTEKPSPIRSALANYCSSESDGDEHHTKCSKPYDPLTNYLSPRPKYLRYNPNRRSRVIDLQDSKAEKKKDDSRLPPVSPSASQKVEVYSQTRRTDRVISPAQEGNTQQENQEQIGGMVELMVERGKCSFKSVFNFMFLLTIIAVSTSYMCSPKNNNVGLRLGNILVANYSSMNIIIQQQAQTNCMNLSSGNRQAECRGVDSVLQVKIEVAKRADDRNNDTFDPNNELLKKSPATKDIELRKLVSDHIESKEAPILRPEVKYADNNDTSDETTQISDRFQLAEIPEIGSETSQELTKSPEDNDNFAQEKNEPLDSEKIVDQDMHIGNEESTSETEKAADFIDDVNDLLEIQQKEEETVNTGFIEDMGRNVEETTSWSHETTEGNEHDETFQHSTVMNTDNVASWSNKTTKENEHNRTLHSTMMDSDNIECDQLKAMIRRRNHSSLHQGHLSFPGLTS